MTTRTQQTFVAKRALFIGRARAFNKGDTVPASHVEKYGWEDLVARPGTKAAKEATGEESDQS